MKGDFSRLTFDPKKHYSSVLMQQGRVQVDADWNEQQAINRHRLETTTHDLICACGAPNTNPGFRITAQGDNQLLIGEGRYYADGILCENDADLSFSNQPDTPPLFDADTGLSEPLQVTELLASTPAGIVYLDVWHRHLTALDDPSIREVALGGPDTATRLKTVWQVKVLPIPGDSLTCDSEPPEWIDLVAPSTGRLTARTVPPDEMDNPCLIPPTASYWRVENGLYRVEIQDSNPDSVTFKWSRDNGSVVTSIQQINGSEITVSSVGPDDILGFAAGQWVEILDDSKELNGLPGQLVQITGVDSAQRVITVDPSPNLLGTSNGVTPVLHPKLRRWDQVQSATVTGVNVTANSSVLEGGIEVEFSNGTYKTGDYWLIPARTATGEIKWPLENPKDPNSNPLALLPFGIEHHYCRLAIVRRLPQTLTVEDCRTIFPCLTDLTPGASCCTAVVEPGESIQVAIDTLPPAGGCVCLKTGTHTITEAIQIARSNIVLKGESPGTRVVRNNGASLLVITDPTGELVSNVIVDQIQFETTNGAEQVNTLFDLALATVFNGENITLQRCGLTVAVSTENGEAATLPVVSAVGVAVLDSIQITLRHNQFNRLLVGIWAEGCTALTVAENRLITPPTSVRDTIFPFGYVGIVLNLNPDLGDGSDCRVIQNEIQDFWSGIVAGAAAENCQIFGNQVRRPTLDQVPSEAFTGQFFTGSEPYVHGIITYAPDCIIAENTLDLKSPSYGGIRAFGPSTWVEKNTLIAEILPASLATATQVPYAIFLGQTPQTVTLLENLTIPLASVSDNSVICDNQISGILNAIGIAETDHVEVRNNQIIFPLRRQPAVTVAIAILGSRNITVRDNRIQRAFIGILLIGTFPTGGISNQVLGNYLSDGSYGIGALSEAALQVSQNTIENMRVVGFVGDLLWETVALKHNQIRNCGYQPPALQTPDIISAGADVGAGILLLTVIGDLCIESSEILNTGISKTGQVNSEGTYWGIGIQTVISLRISGNLIHYSDVINFPRLEPAKRKEHRSLVVIGWPFSPTAPSLPMFPWTGNALVTNNIFGGLGYPYLVQFVNFVQSRYIGFEQVNFSNNQCLHLSPQSTVVAAPSAGVPATISVWGKLLIVMGNHVKNDIQGDDLSFPSINLNAPEQVNLLGNITSDEIINVGSGVKPANFSDFNVQV